MVILWDNQRNVLKVVMSYGVHKVLFLWKSYQIGLEFKTRKTKEWQNVFWQIIQHIQWLHKVEKTLEIYFFFLCKSQLGLIGFLLNWDPVYTIWRHTSQNVFLIISENNHFTEVFLCQYYFSVKAISKNAIKV